MAKAKCPECEEGAPGWLVGFADMTTLLLCFFIFLLVTAKVDVKKLDAARGYMAHKMGILPENVTTQTKKDMEREEDGQNGDEETVTMVDEGQKLSIGGKEMFEKGKAIPNMSQEFQEEILGFVRKIIGLRNIIEVRGHTGKNEIGINSVFEDEMQLSLERARSIANYMVKTGNVRRERIRIVGCGANERLESNIWLAKEEKNRRVEIRITAKFQDFNPNTDIR